MKLEINHSLNTQSIPNYNKKLHKDGLNKKYNQPRYWEQIEIETMQELAVLVSSGTSIRPGLRIGGSQSRHIKHLELLIFDVDGGADIRKVITDDVDEIIGLIYATPGYTEELKKFRIVCVLDTSVHQKTKYKNVYAYYQKKYFPFSDKAVGRFDYFFYGAAPNTEDKIYVNENYRKLDGNILNGTDDTEKVEKVEVEVMTPDNVIEINDKIEKKEAEYWEYLAENLPYNEPNKLFYLYEHNFKETEPDRSDIIKKYHGANPFSPTDSSKTSFVISYKKGQKFPLWCDRSGHAKAGKNDGEGSNYIGYVIEWHKVHKDEDISFKDACNYICDHFNVQQFQFKNSNNLEWDDYYKKYATEIYKRFRDWYPDRGKVLSEGIAKLEKQIYYIQENRTWVTGTFSYFFDDFKKYLFETYPHLKTSKYHEFDKTFRYSMQLIMINESRRIYEFPERTRAYAVFNNGFFSMEDKTFSSFVPGVYSPKGYPYDYEEISKDEADHYLGKIRDYFNLSYNDNPINAEIVYIWTILNILGKAYITENHLGLTGDAGCGKSTNMGLIEELSHIRGTNCPPSTFLEDNKFGLWSLAEYDSLFVNEFTGNSRYMKAMNRITGTGRPQRIMIEPKGEKPYKVLTMWSITTVTEGQIAINSKEAGALRRYIFVRHPKRTRKDVAKDKKLMKILTEFMPKRSDDGGKEGEKQEKTQTQLENIRKLTLAAYQYCDYRELIDRWRVLTDSEEQDSIKHEIALDNSIYGEFIQTYIEVTNKEEDYITKEELDSMAYQYNNSFQKSVDKISTGKRMIRYFKGELTKLFFWEYGEKSDRKRINGRNATIYKGLKPMAEIDMMEDDF